MATYLGMRIIAGAMDYDVVIPKYPQFKDDVDEYLRDNGREDLIPKKPTE